MNWKDVMGRYYTEALFLETGYDTTTAIYTLTAEDKEYKGKIYPSLRRIYMECGDPTEYKFAIENFCNWEHWQKVQGNAKIAEHIEEWRSELEVKLRSKGVMSLMKISGSNFNAAKWAADGGWGMKRGRPSKAEKAREKAIREKVAKEVEDDSSRIVKLVRKES